MCKLFKWLIWLIKGKPYLTYPGFHCGLCGIYVKQKFTIPVYKSLGKWWDTWGICPRCNKK